MIKMARFVFYLLTCVFLVSGFGYLDRGVNRYKKRSEFLEENKIEVSEHEMKSLGIEPWQEDVITTCVCFIFTIFLVVLKILCDSPTAVMSDRAIEESVRRELENRKPRAREVREAEEVIQLIYRRSSLPDEDEHS